MLPSPPTPTLFPYTTLFRSVFSSWPDSREVLPAARDTPVRSQHKSRVSTLHEASCFSSGLRAMPHTQPVRSEEHTSELQSHSDLVCRLLLEKKKKNKKTRES